jgi:HEPN domain-containing protein
MDKALVSLTREWLTKDFHDLQTARIVSTVPDRPLDTAIYHCQQTAEKAMKGWLTATGIAFEKTHDVRRLVRYASGPEPEFDQLSECAEVPTPYASAFRYPGLTADPMPTREELDEALQHAQAIYEFVVSRLPVEAHP